MMMRGIHGGIVRGIKRLMDGERFGLVFIAAYTYGVGEQGYTIWMMILFLIHEYTPIVYDRYMRLHSRYQ